MASEEDERPYATVRLFVGNRVRASDRWMGPKSASEDRCGCELMNRMAPTISTPYELAFVRLYIAAVHDSLASVSYTDGMPVDYT